MTAPVAVAVSREYVEIWRIKGCAAFEAVYADENGVTCSELLVWNADGDRSCYTMLGIDMGELCRHWEAASPAFGAMQVPNDAGRKVWTHLEPEEDEPVDVPIRMMPPLEAEKAPDAAVAAAPVQNEDEAAAVEIPPVADHVAEAARRLSVQIWSGVSVPRAQLAPTNDQALAHAVHMEWLVVAGALVVRGGVDPRPVSVTRIPN